MKSTVLIAIAIGLALIARGALAETPTPRGAPSASEAAQPSGDWAKLLPDLMPGVVACLKKTPAFQAVVVKAWPMDRGLVGVRIRGNDNRRWDCVAPLKGDAVNRIDPVTDSANVLPGEGSPLFVYGPKLRIPKRCHKGEKVLDRDGHPLGWLCYKSF